MAVQWAELVDDMPNPFDFIRRPIVGLGRKINQGVHALEDQFDPTRRQPIPQGADVNPAELAHVRSALPPSFNGTPNPATQPRPVQPNPNAPMMSDRPSMPINTRPRQVTPPLDAPAVEAPAMERPTATRPRYATPYKAAENEYVGDHGKRGFKEILKGGLYGMAASGGQGGLGGLVGGFAGGALGQAIAPQQMAEARFAMGPGRRVGLVYLSRFRSELKETACGSSFRHAKDAAHQILCRVFVFEPDIKSKGNVCH